MDSKLIGSNIAILRATNIHQHLHSINHWIRLQNQALSCRQKQLELLMKEESGKTVYHSTKDELRANPNYRYSYLQLTGALEYLQTELYQLLQRVFNEQYKVRR